MSALHQMVPMFFLIQFVMVLIALTVAMLWADPQCSVPAKKVPHGVGTPSGATTRGGAFVSNCR
jgi:hypothetical protein